eukprot:Opistho-2@64508
MPQPVRLYTKGVVLGHRRNMRNQDPSTQLLRIEGVESKEATAHYLGKRIAYVYRAQRKVKDSKIRVIWGKVTRPHGNGGVVRAKFSPALPARTFGASVRVLLYPSRV